MLRSVSEPRVSRGRGAHAAPAILPIRASGAGARSVAPFRVPLALSWALLAYAAVAVAAGGAFAVLRIHADYLEVMRDEDAALLAELAERLAEDAAISSTGLRAAPTRAPSRLLGP